MSTKRPAAVGADEEESIAIAKEVFQVDEATAKTIVAIIERHRTGEPAVHPGQRCDLCRRQMPKNAKPAKSLEDERERRKEYNSRPEVIERRKAYQAKRREELAELRRLKQQLEAQEEEPNA